MLSKNQIKFINGLKRKKKRLSEQLFIAEGEKVVGEFLAADFELFELFATTEYRCPENVEFQEVSEKELKAISSFATPNKVLAVFKIPEQKPVVRVGLALALDGVNDPGNLGTIIRLCDWFDITQLICSTDTVDCFNPKTVQASMGSLSRTKINYLDLKEHLMSEDRPIYGTFMNGKNLYQSDLNKEAVLVLGNEANGISEEIGSLVNEKVSIPQFGKIQSTESLNVAMATAIFLSEFRR